MVVRAKTSLDNNKNSSQNEEANNLSYTDN